MRNYQILKKSKHSGKKRKKNKLKIGIKYQNEEDAKISDFFILKITIFLSVTIFLIFLLTIDKKYPKLNEANITSSSLQIKQTAQEIKPTTPNLPISQAHEKENSTKNTTCEIFDPINLIKRRVDNGPIEMCEGKKSKHVCYQNVKNYYNDIFYMKNGVFCEMENIVLDPLKSRQSGLSFLNGPVDTKNHGMPLLSKGFINAECNPKKKPLYCNYIYRRYFNSWNYEYNSNDEKEELEELAPGKIIFFISRNQDSPNLFHGNSEVINALAVIYLFNLNPKDIQVIFLESIEIPVTLGNQTRDPDKPEDPFYYIYKNVLSQGGEPIYIKNLKKKYKISRAFSVSINWDTPRKINLNFTQCDKTSKTYKLYNDLIDKYMDLKPFEDKFITDNDTYYYPESVIKSHESGIKFDKIVTIQWRKVWPKNRKGQVRIFNNALELTYKLSTFLPKNILIRLIDTAKFKMEDQISIMKNTDYLIGLHGAGLALGIFLPQKSIFHEFTHEHIISTLGFSSSLSGHKTYVEFIKSNSTKIDGNENVDLDENEFIEKVISRMKENNFF